MSTQQKFWDREHLKPETLSQLTQTHMSAAVRRFYDWLKELNVPLSNGISIGCGKGRNEIGFAMLGIEMTGLDFSLPAVVEAEERAKMRIPSPTRVHFYRHDITTAWPMECNSYDIGLDSFALADVESPVGRKFAAQEMIRVLRPNGHLLVYTLSSEDEYSAHWLCTSPRKEEPNTYTPPSGKFEKCFNLQELVDLYEGLRLIVSSRVEKTTTYEGKVYRCKHHWVIFQK